MPFGGGSTAFSYFSACGKIENARTAAEKGIPVRGTGALIVCPIVPIVL